MKYSYYDAMSEDIRNYITENVDLAEYAGDRDGLETALNDEMWTADDVTGNASGSYTFNRWTARGYVTENVHLVEAAVHEYGWDATEIAKHFLDEDGEWFDVLIRCYLLPSVLGDVLDAMEIDGAFEEKDEEETA